MKMNVRAVRRTGGRLAAIGLVVVAACVAYPENSRGFKNLTNLDQLPPVSE